MKRYKVRFTREAEDDLLRLYDFLLGKNVIAAERALAGIKEAINVLRFSPFSCRKVLSENSFLRELIIPFGSDGYVALFEIASGIHPGLIQSTGSKKYDFCFPSFSMVCNHRKWRHLPVPREALPFAELP
ncbi:MAG: type II toxin-antitoxin system RelE/ParE family toxin [Gammaproteobacteria bacterium]|nr:type II toxin-antitoxin system RelE/ParE family toxin [Gammaproteobacteria bacterium]